MTETQEEQGQEQAPLTRQEALEADMARHLYDAYGCNFDAFRADVGVACANLREEVRLP